MNTIHGAATAQGQAVRPAGAGRDAAFSRHQAWLREFEKAREAAPGRHDGGPASAPEQAAPGRTVEADGRPAIQALPGGPSSWLLHGGGAASWPHPPGAHAVPYAVPSDASAHRTARPGMGPADLAAVCLPRAVPVGADAGACRPILARPRAAEGPEHGFEGGAESGPAPSGQPYAEQAAQVYRRGDRLALVLRDARLPQARCEDILKALIGKGLPAGLREISVTLNGHTRAIQLPDQGD